MDLISYDPTEVLEDVIKNDFMQQGRFHII